LEALNERTAPRIRVTRYPRVSIPDNGGLVEVTKSAGRPRPWDVYLTDRDRLVDEISGYGGTLGYGSRPAVLVVDTTNNFCGDKPEPLLESVKRWRNSCGEEAWRSVEVIARVLDAARAQRVPVIYSTGTPNRGSTVYSGRWAGKNTRRGEDAGRANGHDIVGPIAPRDEDIVIRKTKPSVFFGTPLVSYLVELGVDQLLVCGGCVRATVVDAFSSNFRVAVIDEATFDRSEAARAMNLYDMNQKYADIVSADEAIEYLSGLPVGLFDRSLAKVPAALS
jgi:maleamate amidohydrolase